jgi:uncharacterized protein YwgA
MSDKAILPLLLASDQLAPGAENEALDRLRLQKGIFIMQMGGPDEWKGAYTFKPWDWGPFSRDLTTEVADLIAQGLVTVEQVRGRRYPRYRTTAEGDQRVAQALSQMDASQVSFVRKVRAYVTSRSFTQLLREVYARFPEYAVNSRFQA